jgi:hypothetical protein
MTLYKMAGTTPALTAAATAPLVPQVKIPAEYLRKGKIIRAVMRGKTSTVITTPGDQTFTIGVGPKLWIPSTVDKVGDIVCLPTSLVQYKCVTAGSSDSATAPSSVNLLDHGDCEAANGPHITTETDDYDPDATVARSTTVVRTGTYSQKFIKTHAANVGEYYPHDVYDAADLIQLTAGVQYTWSFWLYIPKTGLVKASEITYGYGDNLVAGAGSLVETSQSPLPIYNEWQKCSITFTLRALATGAEVFIRCAGTAGTNAFFYFDDVVLAADETCGTSVFQYHSPAITTVSAAIKPDTAAAWAAVGFNLAIEAQITEEGVNGKQRLMGVYSAGNLLPATDLPQYIPATLPIEKFIDTTVDNWLHVFYTSSADTASITPLIYTVEVLD